MTYDEIKKSLAMVDNPADKLEMLMDIGARMEEVPSMAVCHEIEGCASRAEICVGENNRFYGRADSAVVRGIVAVLTSMVDGLSAEDRRELDIAGQFGTLGLSLGAGRLNGVNSMIRFLKNL